MPPTVVIVGGGYGGVAAARALDDETDVILVEPRDAFVHNVAALRGLVDPAWTDRIFMPYRRLLDRGQVIRDRVVAEDAKGVTLGSGEKVTADYLVLATGSAYPFPRKTGEDESAWPDKAVTIVDPVADVLSGDYPPEFRHAGILAFAAVVPHARGLGAGRALGEAVIAWAAQAGYY
jgi:flavin-dependent dehydrogenase